MRHPDQGLAVTTAALLLLAAGTVVGGDETAARDALRELRRQTLDELYREDPTAKTLIRKAAGYGVFGVTGVQIVFVGGSGGRGVVRDNLTGRDTYMRMGAVSGGLGVGFKDTRTVLIFRRRDVLKQFLDKGWSFGAEAEATATVEGKGGMAGAPEMPDGITVYQLNVTGLMAKGTVQGTKFWKDDELN
jgi:lipid-binding SYLF domain-containing protein